MYATYLASSLFIDLLTAPSKPAKNPTRRSTLDNDGRHSPLQPLDFGLAGKAALASSQSLNASGSASKPANLLPPLPISLPAKAPTAPIPLGHIRETLPMPFILQQPEEQTDNWDDDFEEGISLTKLQG